MVLKAQAREKNGMKFMFETMEYTHFGYNPFTKAGDNMYRKESTDGKNGMGSTLAFYVRSEMGEYAAAYGGSADRCNRNTNGHKHGSSICFNSFKGDKTLAMNGNLNSQSTWGAPHSLLNIAASLGSLVCMLVTIRDAPQPSTPHPRDVPRLRCRPVFVQCQWMVWWWQQRALDDDARGGDASRWSGGQVIRRCGSWWDG